MNNSTWCQSERNLSPIFSQKGGFYSSDFELSLSIPSDSLSIYYTLDGSEPSPNCSSTFQYKNTYAFTPEEELGDFKTHKLRSFLYQQPISISATVSNETNYAQFTTAVGNFQYKPQSRVSKSTVVRAAAFHNEHRVSDIVSHTYFIHPTGRKVYQLPVISITTSPQHLFNYENGIYTPGKAADEWRAKHPNENFSWIFPGNYHLRGKKNEHLASIEFFPKYEAHAEFSHNFGLRIHGNATRTFPMKSLRLLAKKKYGQKHFEGNLFHSNKIEKHTRLILRNGGNDFPTSMWQYNINWQTLFRDGLAQSLLTATTIETQQFQPVVLFLNGEFWGVHNLRERYDEYYFNNKYGIHKDSVAIVDSWYTAKRGDANSFFELMEFLKNHSIASDNHYQFIKNQLDTDALIDYYCLQLYIHNTDWPANNVAFWRSLETNNIDSNSYHLWRPLLNDTDFGFGLFPNPLAYKENTLAFAVEKDKKTWPNPASATLPFRRLLDNENFTIQFIKRFEELLRSDFSTEKVVQQIDSFANMYRPHIAEHFERWNISSIHYYHWNRNVAFLKQYALKRPYYLKKIITQYFSLADTSFLPELQTEPTIRISELHETHPRFFFAKKLPASKTNYTLLIILIISALVLVGFILKFRR